MEELAEVVQAEETMEELDSGRSRGGIAYWQALEAADARLRMAGVLQRAAEAEIEERQRLAKNPGSPAKSGVRFRKTGAKILRMVVYAVEVDGIPVALVAWWDYCWRVIPLDGRDDRWEFQLLRETKNWCRENHAELLGGWSVDRGGNR